MFVPCFFYAFFRYTIFHDEQLYDLPFYLLNKVFGVTASIMIGLAYVIGPLCPHFESAKKYISHRKYLGLGGLVVGICHSFMSVLLMAPANYKLLYVESSGRLNWQGSFSMLFGTLALIHLCFLAVVSIPPVMREMHALQWKNIQRGGVIILYGLILHVASFGYLSWFDMSKWYGGMPPYSLIGAGSIFLLILIRNTALALKKIKHNKSVFSFPLALSTWVLDRQARNR